MRRLVLLVQIFISALPIFCSLLYATPAQSKDKNKVVLTVAVAASLSDAFADIRKAYRKEHSDIGIEFTIGSSGQAEQQILQGAPIDVFVSASTSSVQTLVGKGLVDGRSVARVASNKLVLVVSENRGMASADVKVWQDLDKNQVKRLAIGNPDHVPAGQYAKSLLNNMKIWSKVQSKLIYGEDVRQVCQYTAMGEVDAGIVYRSDIKAVDGIRVAALAPTDVCPPIVYQAAVVKSSHHQEDAKELVKYITSYQAQAILRRWGFIPVK